MRNTRFIADLSRPYPSLCFAEDRNGVAILLACDPYGRLYRESFKPSEIKTMLSYDQGFGGYGVQALIPFPSFPASRDDKEQAAAFAFHQQLRQLLSTHPALSPPLLLLENACHGAQVDFVETFVHFLREWNATPGMTFVPKRPLPAALERALTHLDWKIPSKRDQQTILWTNHLFEQLESAMNQGNSIQNVLKKNHWPLLSEFEEHLQDPQEPSSLNVLAEQFYRLVHYLPELEFPSNPSDQMHTALLSTYFRIYGIDHQLLFPLHKGDKEPFDALEAFWKGRSSTHDFASEKEFVLETALTHSVIPAPAPLKLEECRPGIVFEFQQGQERETAAFVYDPQGTGIKWPILKGKFLTRFQSNHQEIPYRIRLRQARQIAYPESTQIYSYESDVLVSEKGNLSEPFTLSMNQVYETWDGYRFYLSGVASSTDSNLKRIQLAVNHDPAKYFLTYPGALLVFTGIALLFWILPYRKK